MKVIAIPEVVEYIESLVPILYRNGYFSYEDSARKYVDDLYDDIEANLPTKLHRPAPRYFNRYGRGMKYAAFKKSKHTTWYAFFKTYNMGGETVFLIRYIANNHIIAQYL
jgi:hypothetical protein